MLLAHINAAKQVCLGSKNLKQPLYEGIKKLLFFYFSPVLLTPLITLHSYLYSHVFIVIAVLDLEKDFFKQKNYVFVLSSPTFGSYPVEINK